MGYHKRTILNLKILKIGIFKDMSFDSVTFFDINKKDINCMGGFPKYGIIRNDYIIIKVLIEIIRVRLQELLNVLSL